MHAYLSIHRIARLLASTALLATLQAANWPAWRGSFDGSGAAHGDQAPVRWSPTENIRWKTELPGPGNSSPIVWDDRVLIAQASGDGTRRSLLCFKRSDGTLLWQSGITYSEPEETHKDNPQASSTPVTDGERVIVWFGSAGLFCFDMDGREVWRRDLGKQEHEWGYGASPVLFEDLCILNFGPGKHAFLSAFEKATGRTVWRVDVPEIRPTKRTDGFAGRGPGVVGSWSTPILVEAIAQCWELNSGTLLWEERVRGSGSSSDSWSSMVRVEDRLYVLNHSGETVVLRASPKFEVIAVNGLGGERCNSTVAVSNGELFIRTHKRLWCVGGE